MEKKDDRLELRASERQASVIREAAAEYGKSTSAFVLDAAYNEAQRLLADRRVFVLDDEQWSRFTELLDRPVAPTEALRRLKRNGPLSE